MSPALVTEILITEIDFARLSKLRDQHLSECLDGADLVASQAIPADVVTMYSQIELLDHTTGQPSTLTLSYPHDADPSSGSISVCSALGASLLGRRVGERVSWRSPQGQERAVSIQAMLFQPEASGDYTT